MNPDRLDAEVEWAHRKRANLAQRAELDQERDGLHWQIVKVDGVTCREAAQAIHERLAVEGFTADEIRALGVSEATIKRVAPLRHKP